MYTSKGQVDQCFLYLYDCLAGVRLLCVWQTDLQKMGSCQLLRQSNLLSDPFVLFMCQQGTLVEQTNLESLNCFSCGISCGGQLFADVFVLIIPALEMAIA